MISNLATKAALNTKATYIESKIPDTTDFVTAPEFNGLTKITFGARIIKAKKSLCEENSSRY